VEEFPKIVALRTIGPGLTRVFFATGEARDVDWKEFAELGTVFADFTDPEFATSCVIIEEGSGLEWPNGADWSAGAVKQVGVAVSLPIDQRRSA
jgi:hypothetical protein